MIVVATRMLTQARYLSSVMKSFVFSACVGTRISLLTVKNMIKHTFQFMSVFWNIFGQTSPMRQSSNALSFENPPRGQRGGEVTAKPEDLVTWRSLSAAAQQRSYG